MDPKREIYVSTDIEADGPTPGPYSMLSFASAAYTAEKELLDTFSVNLETLPGAGQHPRTMTWWEQFPEAWAKCREDTEAPETALPRYAQWLRDLPGRPVFVGYPASFDFMFVCWYLVKFAEDNPFGFGALDVKSYAMAVLGRGFHKTTKHKMPKAWFDELPHTHVALDDALEQGALFCNILAARSTFHGPVTG